MDAHQLAEEFLHLVKYVNKSSLMNRFNLYSHGELLVLVYLLHHEGELIVPSDISKYTRTSTARVATILNNLEEKGYIKRDIDRQDRRKILVTITESGKNKAECEKKETLVYVSKILEKMGEEDARTFIRTLKSFYEIGSQLLEEEKK